VAIRNKHIPSGGRSGQYPAAGAAGRGGPDAGEGGSEGRRAVERGEGLLVGLVAQQQVQQAQPQTVRVRVVALPGVWGAGGQGERAAVGGGRHSLGGG
jgi:hypothetical protein